MIISITIIIIIVIIINSRFSRTEDYVWFGFVWVFFFHFLRYDIDNSCFSNFYFINHCTNAPYINICLSFQDCNDECPVFERQTDTVEVTEAFKMGDTIYIVKATDKDRTAPNNEIQ